MFTPGVDGWSPLGYAIGSWIHCDTSVHSGFQTTFRHFLDCVHILHGLFVQSSMGPRDPSSYSVTPAFWVSQADLFGPLTIYVLGWEASTRNSLALHSKLWAMDFVCCLSKAINIQVVEGHSAALLADGLILPGGWP